MAVNFTMVYAYFEIGRMIVEEEQNGKNRAAYGKQILQELSQYLTAQFGKGFSVDNLKLMRRFYVIYANDQIGETVFPQFENLPATETGRRFYLSWSHYLKLMRIDNVEERHFYEIESVKNDWSLSELKRQFNVLLCQQKSDALVELTLPEDSNIYASKYELYLPDKKELQEKLREWIAEETGGEKCEWAEP